MWKMGVQNGKMVMSERHISFVFFCMQNLDFKKSVNTDGSLLATRRSRIRGRRAEGKKVMEGVKMGSVHNAK
jgi:hypothetical protein